MFCNFSDTSKQQVLRPVEEPRLLTQEVPQEDLVMAMVKEEVITTGVAVILEVDSLMMAEGGNNLQEVREVIAGAGLLLTQEIETDKVE